MLKRMSRLLPTYLPALLHKYPPVEISRGARPDLGWLRATISVFFASSSPSKELSLHLGSKVSRAGSFRPSGRDDLAVPI
jgi:hypothetical protein